MFALGWCCTLFVGLRSSKEVGSAPAERGEIEGGSRAPSQKVKSITQFLLQIFSLRTFGASSSSKFVNLKSGCSFEELDT